MGWPVSLGSGRVLEAVLYGVSPADWRLPAAAGVLLVGACVVAAAGPAWRASRVDPAETLRGE